MPDTFANPYGGTSPLGAALKNLSGVLMKPSTEAAQINHLEHALAQKQKRENTAALGDMLRNLGTEQFNRQAAIDNAVRAGVSPDNLGGYERYNSANQFGAADPRTSNAVVGAGGSYGSTAAGFREGEAGTNARAAATLQENARQFDNKPITVGTDRGPVIARQSEAYGQPAVEDLGKVKGNVARVAVNSPAGLAGADDATKQFIGVEGKGNPTPHQWVTNTGETITTYDGLTDPRTNQPLPPGKLVSITGGTEAVGLRPGVQADLQKQNIALDQFRSLHSYTKALAKADPGNFGVQGNVKGMFQDAAVVADNIAASLGYRGLQDGLAAARQKAIAGGVDPATLPSLFDPRLPALHTAAGLAVYSAAAALAGQEGRAASKDDIARVTSYVGDPAEWSMNQQKFLAKMDTIQNIVEDRQKVIDKYLPRSNPAAGPAAPGVAASPMSPAPGAPSLPTPAPSTPAPIVWGRDVNGLPVPMGQ